MSYGITENGFVIKTVTEIINEMLTELKQQFGDDFDTREGTPQYQIVAAVAAQLGELWENNQNLYSQRYVNLATGVALNYAVKFAGLRRNQATAATGEITISGTDGTIIPAEFLISTQDNIIFKTLESGTISGGSVNLNIIAEETGTNGNVAADTITKIVNPLSGVDSVTNVLETSGGSNQETDVDLRTRYFASLALGGGSTSNAVRSALLQVDNVKDAICRENDTMYTVNGIPPKSIAPVVLNGTDVDIISKILETKAAGIQSYGTITDDVEDENGNIITIGFTRPTEISIWIRVTVTKGSEYPPDGDTQIRDIVVDYINNLKIGVDVILFKISIEIVNNVTGIDNLLIESSLDGITYTTNDIIIAEIEKAVTDNAKVTVI